MSRASEGVIFNKMVVQIINGMLLLISFCVQSQNNKIDSLKNVITQSESDSVKINSLIELSKEYQFLDYDQAKSIAEEASDLAEKNNI